MYALAVIRYRRSIEEVNRVTEAHRAYLRELKKQGILVAAGPFDPRTGGAILLRINDADAQAALDRVRDDDPFTKEKIANYELLNWNVGIGLEDLDKI
jgi:uncharacterized protein YciI